MVVNNRTHDKVKTLDELAVIVSDLKKSAKKVVHCHGVFDIVHPGHIRHFEAARNQGDVLIVTITPDIWVGKGPGRPIFGERIRAEFISALEVVDYVAINAWPTAIETIKKLKPNVYCKGSDYVDAKQDLTGKIQYEKDAIESVGGRLHFTDEITFSSTKIANQRFDVFPDEAVKYLRNLRTYYTSDQVIGMFQKVRQLRVLVIGETIIDEYHYCTPLGKSAKENLIPAQFLYEETFAGGSLAIANHVAGFCEKVDLVSCLGAKNSYAEFIHSHIKPNVNPKFFLDPVGTTIVKRRFVQADMMSKLFEIYFMDNSKLLNGVSQELHEYITSVIENYDVVVIADYGHGLLNGTIVDTLCSGSKLLAVNTQTNAANIGFNLITKYPRADVICIDEPEIRLATHDTTTDVNMLAVKIANNLKCPKLIVTRGHRGSLVYDKDEGFFEIPVFSRDIIDRVGAGDAYFSVATLCVAAGFPSELIGFIGNAVGALKIRIVGNKSSIEPASLFKYIKTLLA